MDNLEEVGNQTNSDRKRIFVPNALGADEFLRVTWHEGRSVMVFSHWEGDQCVAATPVRVSDIAELAELTVTALTRSLTRASTEWSPPCAADRVAISLGLERPA